MIFKKPPQKVITSKIYVGEKLVSETAKVLPPPGKVNWPLAIAIMLVGLWLMFIRGMI